MNIVQSVSLIRLLGSILGLGYGIHDIHDIHGLYDIHGFFFFFPGNVIPDSAW